MPIYEVVIVPLTVSPVIREMHTHRRQFIADSMSHAKKLCKKACEENPDWDFQSISEIEKDPP